MVSFKLFWSGGESELIPESTSGIFWSGGEAVLMVEGTSTPSTGWNNVINGVSASNIYKINGILLNDISKINGTVGINQTYYVIDEHDNIVIDELGNKIES